MIIYLRLFFEFFKTGLFAIGGGLATLPFLQKMAASTGWFTTSDLANMVAISESTPGPLGINMATYVGYTTSINNGLPGVIGSVVAPLGLVAPSIIIIVIIAGILNKFKNNATVNSVFYGLRPASTALIAVAGCEVIKIALLNISAFQTSGSLLDLFFVKGILLAVVLYFAIKKLKWHPIAFIALSAVIGAVLKF